MVLGSSATVAARAYENGKRSRDMEVRDLENLVEKLAGVVADYERGVNGRHIDEAARGLLRIVRERCLEPRMTYSG